MGRRWLRAARTETVNGVPRVSPMCRIATARSSAITARFAATAVATTTAITAADTTTGRAACHREITYRPAATSAPTATDWKLNAKRKMATGAAPRWTTLTSAAELWTITD